MKLKETACQRELAHMMDKKLLSGSLMEMCYGCSEATIDRPVVCRRDGCHVRKALETSGYTIPTYSIWEDE